ncbi:hypothetical protein Cylst_4301 [Cylindrospermum stagnale PCC 7417]|uniref:Uncharacterized protein n=1 Tax=Cylindrospermum stagnale PCC 7417 TaxID=56107 RepID=K9X199_9NOST|nr:hypothetical protein Cylst_4301 [Cylindrospermum stagnale PCC 7417]
MERLLTSTLMSKNISLVFTGNISAGTITTVSGVPSAIFCIRLFDKRSREADQRLQRFLQNQDSYRPSLKDKKTNRNNFLKL